MTALSEPPTVLPGEAEPPTRREELAWLVHAHQQSVWRLLRFLGADPAEAEDLTQETFLAVARRGCGRSS